MIKNEIAAKYSQALLELGRENGKLVEMKTDLNKIWKLIQENENLSQVLFHQRILADEKKAVLNKIFKNEFNQISLNFVKLLIDKRRIQFLEIIINRFNQLVNKEESIIEVEVTSAITLEEEILEKLKRKLEQLIDYQIIMKSKIDSSLIGGVVLKIGNYIIDGSIKSKLKNLEEKIEKIPVSKLGV